MGSNGLLGFGPGAGEEAAAECDTYATDEVSAVDLASEAQAVIAITHFLDIHVNERVGDCTIS